jgi:maltooligosyltrehalose synthase
MSDREPVFTAIRATYRLQFHKGFTFRDATALVPYLARLGISHIYASPLMEARPGSTHGYDIVNHNRLNPEIGTEAEFSALVAALKAEGMGSMSWNGARPRPMPRISTSTGTRCARI